MVTDMSSLSPSALLDLIQSPRVALLANVALVLTGSVLALLSLIDLLTGVLIVVIGFVGIYASLLGQRTEDDEE
ncbi:major facilitator family transporter [Natrialba hulunbeirensis JCM 10989]|uniref:Major facilitator family transporter n=2 Tax=Natrialba hulunbeirensis TaxID=123783 RepID=M0A5I7_9EURY|nr:major facilitator family transporter [Natrialba hulunbeirensis JCM 10989]